MDSSGPFGLFRLVPRFSNYGEMINHNTTNYFVLPNAVGLKSETPHTVGFKIPRNKVFYSLQHCTKKISDTANPHFPLFKHKSMNI